VATWPGQSRSRARISSSVPVSSMAWSCSEERSVPPVATTLRPRAERRAASNTPSTTMMLLAPRAEEKPIMPSFLVRP